MKLSKQNCCETKPVETALTGPVGPITLLKARLRVSNVSNETFNGDVIYVLVAVCYTVYNIHIYNGIIRKAQTKITPTARFV